jgi:hypothetical protein
MSEETTRGDKLAFGLTLASVVIIPGLGHYFLSGLGYPTVGSAVWAIGYGSGAVVIWYVWIRPLDLTAPDGAELSDADED